MSDPSAIRVLHLIPTLSGGGAERQVSYLLPALTKLGVDAHLGYVHPGPNLARLRGFDGRVHKLSARNNHDPRLFFEVLRLVDELNPHIIQTWLLQADVLGSLVCLWRGLPHLLSERNAEPEEASFSFKPAVRRYLGRFSSGIVANSRQGLGQWHDIIGADGRQHSVIPNAVPVAELEKYRRAREATARGREVILYSGRYERQKNVEQVLRVAEAVLRTRPSAEARFFGEGSLRSTLNEMAENSPCRDRIHIGGYTDELWQWMSKASVLVLLSRHEGQPNVALEAAAIGCPLVLSDIAAHRELFGVESARLVDPRDVDLVARAIEDVLDDPAETSSKAEKARKLVGEFSVERCARSYHEFYQDLMDERKPNRPRD